MRLVVFREDGHELLGLVTADGVIAVSEAAAHLRPDLVPRLPTQLADLFTDNPALHETLQQFASYLAGIRSATAPPTWLRVEDTLHLAPCVPPGGKILCVGLNYRAHIVESAMDVPPVPVLFPKFANALAAAGEAIALQPFAEQYDYEAELAVVIGQRTHAVTPESALATVFGYCNANDLSARDLQFRTSQWLLGKALDHFLPIGPYLVTADDVPDPQNLTIQCWLNGTLKQDAVTSQMLWPVAHLISFISHYVTLEPGDVILTGTPEGVIFGQAEPEWLRPGDQVEIAITGLGRLSTPFIAPSLP